MAAPQPSTEHIVVVNPQGRVTTEGDTVIRLRDRLVSSIEHGQRSILLDVSQVSYMDSLLLGELVQAYVTAVKRGARLNLINVTSRLRELLRVTKLDRVLRSTDQDHTAP
jgi:anti-sigma B factor antagonist